MLGFRDFLKRYIGWIVMIVSLIILAEIFFSLIGKIPEGFRGADEIDIVFSGREVEIDSIYDLGEDGRFRSRGLFEEIARDENSYVSPPIIFDSWIKMIVWRDHPDDPRLVQYAEKEFSIFHYWLATVAYGAYLSGGKVFVSLWIRRILRIGVRSASSVG